MESPAARAGVPAADDGKAPLMAASELPMSAASDALEAAAAGRSENVAGEASRRENGSGATTATTASEDGADAQLGTPAANGAANAVDSKPTNGGSDAAQPTEGETSGTCDDGVAVAAEASPAAQRLEDKAEVDASAEGRGREVHEDAERVVDAGNKWDADANPMTTTQKSGTRGSAGRADDVIAKSGANATAITARGESSERADRAPAAEDSIAMSRPRRAAAQAARPAPPPPKAPATSGSEHKRAAATAAIGAVTPPVDAEERRHLRDKLLRRSNDLLAERKRLDTVLREPIIGRALSWHRGGAVYMPADGIATAASGQAEARSTARWPEPPRATGAATIPSTRAPTMAAAAIDTTDASARHSGGGGGGGGSSSSVHGSPSISTSGRLRTPSQRVHHQPGERLDGATILRRYPQMRYCLRVLRDLMKMKGARAFLLPVDKLWAPEFIPGYFDVITHPMDLGTVRQKLEAGEYGTDPEAFAQDVRLVWSNAMTYNPPGTEFYELARTLNEVFEKRLQFMPPLGETVGTAHPASSAARKRKHGALAASHRQRGGRKRGAGIGGSAADAFGVGPGMSTAVARGPYGAIGGRGGEESPVGASQRRGGHFARGPGDRRRQRRRMDPADRVRELEQRLEALRREQGEMRAVLESSTAAASPSGGGGGSGSGASPLGTASGLHGRDALASLAKVPITQQEMRQLAEDIGRLSAPQLQRLIDLFGNRPGLISRGAGAGEYEMNIQQASNETLRELQVFCAECLRPAGAATAPSQAMSPTAAGARLASIQRAMLQLENELERNKKQATAEEQRRWLEAGGGGGGGGALGLPSTTAMRPQAGAYGGVGGTWSPANAPPSDTPPSGMRAPHVEDKSDTDASDDEASSSNLSTDDEEL